MAESDYLSDGLFEKIWLNTESGVRLAVRLYPRLAPKGVVHVMHGAGEHKGRYHSLCSKLQEDGFAVIISDMRGHGESTNATYVLGYVDGVDNLLEDQALVMNVAKKRYRNAPYYIFAHSLGSMLARCFLQEHDAEVDKLVMSGMASYIPLVGIGIPLIKTINKIKGTYGYSKIVNLVKDGIGLEDDDWICNNEASMEKFRKDPYCKGFKYHNNGIATILEADNRLNEKERYHCLHPELPILSLSGAEDPITGGPEGITDSMQTLSDVGYTELHAIVYPRMKHEVIHEKEADQVLQDLFLFLEEGRVSSNLGTVSHY